jgi:integrase
MQVKQISISGLLQKYETALNEYGLGFAARLNLLKRAATIINLHERQDLKYLNSQIIADYSRTVTERFNNGSINQKTHLTALRQIERFINFAENNCLTLPNTTLGCRQKLPKQLERIADEFIETIPNPNSRNDARWIAHKYLAWLAEQNIEDVRIAGATEIQKFILGCTKTMTMNSIRIVRLYMMKLYEYLYGKGLSESPYQELLKFKVKHGSKVYPFLPRADIAKLLDTIDRKTEIGKRNYAIMMLGTVLGIRACDVITLKIGDIDWQRGELKFLQAKTGKTAVLPLTQDVGDALEDYILNARPKTAVKEIFLKQRVPRTAISSAVTIGEIYEQCCIKAGLPVTKRFQNLRRSLATSMAMNGISVYDIADGLADAEVESVKPYIASDTKHLKMCALPFVGISPIRSCGGDAQ